MSFVNINKGMQVKRLVNHRTVRKSKVGRKGRDVTEVASLHLKPEFEVGPNQSRL